MSQFPSAMEISESWEDFIELPTLTPKAKHGEIYIIMILRLKTKLIPLEVRH